MKRGIAILFICAAAFAQPQKWPATLEADVKAGSWAAADRVGEAVAEEIDAGRMFASFGEVGEEVKMRNFFAEALEHAGKSSEAEAQQCLARQIADPRPGAPCSVKAAAERERRTANLKADVLASELKIPAAFPMVKRGAVSIVVFSATWCAPCVKELEVLRRFNDPAAQVVVLDVDRLSSEQKAAFVPLESLMGAEVPRLYVVDREGNIRFQVMGFEDDEFFLPKLSWMTGALAKN